MNREPDNSGNTFTGSHAVGITLGQGEYVFPAAMAIHDCTFLSGGGIALPSEEPES